MRFLVNELSYETPIAGGVYQFSTSDNTPLGVSEAWRVTAAPNNRTIYRVDLDARPALGRSLLFHMIIDEAGLTERLVYRYLADDGDMISGNVSFADGLMINRHRVNGIDTTEERPQTPVFIIPPFLFGLGMLARTRPSLVTTLDDQLRLSTLNVTYKAQRRRNLIPITIGRNTFATTRLIIQDTADDGLTYTIWRNKRGYPVKMERSDGIRAVDVRPIQYKK